MKKSLVAAAIVSILAIGAIAFAHGTGGRGEGGYMMGPGYGGGHMMGSGYGGHMMGPMMGWSGKGYGANQKFFNETADLRKELHNKRFEYSEATRDPKTTRETLTRLEKDIHELQEKMYEKAPLTASGGFGGYGCN